jgi:hypothetical protein
MEKDLAELIAEIKQIRTDMVGIVNKIDPGKIIYPGWTIKEMIGHLTAWEIVIDKGLTAYLQGDPPYFMQEQDFDIFNQQAVDFRSDWRLDRVLQEWMAVRGRLLEAIQKLAETDLDDEIVTPWGSERTVREFVEIAGEHEFEHREDAARLTH